MGKPIDITHHSSTTVAVELVEGDYTNRVELRIYSDGRGGWRGELTMPLQVDGETPAWIAVLLRDRLQHIAGLIESRFPELEDLE